MGPLLSQHLWHRFPIILLGGGGWWESGVSGAEAFLSGRPPWDSATSNTAVPQLFPGGQQRRLLGGNTTTPPTVSFGKSSEEGRDVMLVRVNRALTVTLQNKSERSVLPSPSRQQRQGGCKRLNLWSRAHRG